MGLSDVPSALIKAGKESFDFTSNQSKQLLKNAMKCGKKRRKSSKRRTHHKRRKSSKHRTHHKRRKQSKVMRKKRKVKKTRSKKR